MKKILISSFLLLILLSICIFNMKFVNDISYESINYLDEMNELNNLDVEYENLTKTYNKFAEYWKQKSDVLSTLISHEPLEKITELISKLSIALKYNDKFEISENINAIKTKMIEFSDSSELNFKNLF